MVKNAFNNQGGRIYAAPAVNVLEIVSEQIFAESLNWDKSLEHELDWGNNNQFE